MEHLLINICIYHIFLNLQLVVSWNESFPAAKYVRLGRAIHNQNSNNKVQSKSTLVV